MIEIKAGQFCRMTSGAIVMVVSEASEHAWTSKVVYLSTNEDAGYEIGDITYYDDEELQDQVEVMMLVKAESE